MSKRACQRTLDDDDLDTAPLTGFTTRAVEAVIHLREAWVHADDSNRPGIERAICEVFSTKSFTTRPTYYKQFLVHTLDGEQAVALWRVVEVFLVEVQSMGKVDK